MTAFKCVVYVTHWAIERYCARHCMEFKNNKAKGIFIKSHNEIKCYFFFEQN